MRSHTSLSKVIIPSFPLLQSYFPYHFISAPCHHSISAFRYHMFNISCFAYMICILLFMPFCGMLIAVASPEGLTRSPFHEAIQLPFRECTKGESFGPSWSTHWFRITLRIPHEFLKKVISLPLPSVRGIFLSPNPYEQSNSDSSTSLPRFLDTAFPFPDL